LINAAPSTMSLFKLDSNPLRLGKQLVTRRLPGIRFPVLLLPVLAALSGCTTTPPPTTDAIPYSEVRLREGDSIKIAFPGAPTLDTAQQIRRDGKITMTLGGEVTALGKTPTELEKELLKLYESQLAVKQVVVTVNSSAYPVFMTGAILRPGKLMADRPLSVLEAIMEAGGFDYARANLKGVTVLRQFEGQTVSYKLNLKAVLSGANIQPFYLKPSDIVYVPEKFSWF
jgi:polysaccharide export outer membrane protein